MFSPKEIENYKQIKTPDVLKEQILNNVDRTHQKNQKNAIRFAAAMACFILIFLCTNMYLLRNHVLSIDGIPVMYSSRTVKDIAPFSVANEQLKDDLQICIPLEVRTLHDAEITVSDGTITTTKLKDTASDNQVSTIRIEKSDDILWYISMEDIENARCSILINDKKYVYELLYDENNNSYNIRQIKNNQKGEQKK